MQIRSLQILRFIAATGVAYYHTHSGPEFGGAGVDIFFVLSGFIIAMLLTKEEKTPWAFFIDRLTRVAPLYWVVTLALYGALVMRPDLFRSTVAVPEDLVRSLFFIPYDERRGPLLQVGWTLNYEMLFYGAAFMCLLAGRHVRSIAAGLVLIYVAAHLTPLRPAWDNFLTNERLLEFVFGIAVHELVRKGIRTPLPLIFLPLGFATLILAELADPSAHPLLRFGIPSAVIVWSAVTLERFIGPNPLVALGVLLGDASYALYLTHTFVITAFARLGLITSLAGGAVAVAASIIVSVLVYWLIDRPAVRWSRKLLVSRAAHI